jgi:cytochrome c-type biogenesis protein CcmH
VIARLIVLSALIAFTAFSAHGQDAPVTMDQVNGVAEKLYCPVCPNEKLDDCMTQACVQWRAEIADQLAAGESEQQIIDSFVRRYGDRVVAIPQDETLRGLAVYTPYVLAAVIAGIGVITLARWTGAKTRRSAGSSGATARPSDDRYRDQMERDL